MSVGSSETAHTERSTKRVYWEVVAELICGQAVTVCRRHYEMSGFVFIDQDCYPHWNQDYER